MKEAICLCNALDLHEFFSDEDENSEQSATASNIGATDSKISLEP